MTVTTALYEPIVYVYVPGTDTYSFQLEIIGPDAFELWWVDITETRIALASPDEYSVEFFGTRPLYDAGEVTLTREPPAGAAGFSIERNTPITQLLDFNNVTPFPMKMVEYTLDKHTMICQEIAYRKCSAQTSTEMTQLIAFDPYTPFYASEVTFALDKLITILNEIAGTADDCRCDPEAT